MFVEFLRASVHYTERVVPERDGVCAEGVTESVDGGGGMMWDRTETEFPWCAKGKRDDRRTWAEV